MYNVITDQEEDSRSVRFSDDPESPYHILLFGEDDEGQSIIMMESDDNPDRVALVNSREVLKYLIKALQHVDNQGWLAE